VRTQVQHHLAERPTRLDEGGAGGWFYTILPSPILFGVWHKKEGSVGGRILRNVRAMVLQ